jgi:RNA polymerase sigma factor (sigma-70 family)
MSGTVKFSPSDSQFERINRKLTTYFARRIHDRDPSDLAADTWLGIIRVFRGECSLHHFAFTVASAKVFEHRRRRKLVTEPLPDDEELEQYTSNLPPDPSPESVLMFAAGHEALVRALETVRDPFRGVLMLWLDGFDCVEISSRLGVPYNTVRSRLYRGQAQALATLRAEFGL